MNNKSLVINDIQRYKQYIPFSIKPQLPIYEELTYKISEVQEKLEKNFYRVTDINKLKNAVKEGKIKIGKYSVVEEKDNRFYLVKYSDLFAKDFLQIKKLLQKLADLEKNPKFKDYIKSLILAYTNNNFIEPYREWVTLPSDIKYDFIFFPTEPYLDKEFETMLSFESYLKITSPQKIFDSNKDYQNYLRGIVKSFPVFSQVHEMLDISKLTFRVDLSLLRGGATVKFNFIGQNLPNERNFVKNWGAKINLYQTVIEDKVLKGHYPLSKKLMHDTTLTPQDYIDGMIKVVLSHEIVESLMKFEGDEERLKNKYLAIRELNSDVNGIKSYIYYLLKTSLSEKDLKNIVYFHVLDLVQSFKKYYKNKYKTQHWYGYVYTFNCLLQKGAIEIAKDNKLVIYPKKVLDCIFKVSEQTLNLLLEGNELQAKAFLEPFIQEKPLKTLLGLKD